MNNCAFCGHTSDGSSRFCGHCGQRLDAGAERVCARCGVANDAMFMYCRNCSAELGGDPMKTPYVREMPAQTQLSQAPQMRPPLPKRADEAYTPRETAQAQTGDPRPMRKRRFMTLLVILILLMGLSVGMTGFAYMQDLRQRPAAENILP